MNRPHHDENVTFNDLTPMYIWIGTLAKLLVKNGVIEKALLIKEFEDIKSRGSTVELEVGLDKMIHQVSSW